MTGFREKIEILFFGDGREWGGLYGALLRNVAQYIFYDVQNKARPYSVRRIGFVMICRIVPSLTLHLRFYQDALYASWRFIALATLCLLSQIFHFEPIARFARKF